jgi:hypothetical protein
VDLALVTVEDAAFWEGAYELELGVSPRMQQRVDVVGWVRVTHYVVGWLIYLYPCPPVPLSPCSPAPHLTTPYLTAPHRTAPHRTALQFRLTDGNP